MLQRSITYCTVELQETWHEAKRLYDLEYSELPKVFLTCTYRSPEEQDELYNRPWDGIDNDNDGKIDEKDEKVTQAKAGQSYHNHYPARAFDIAFKDKNGLNWERHLFQKFAEIVKRVNPNVRWGGNWKFTDLPHFEL